MSKRASHWPRKRQYWRQQHERMRLVRELDISAQANGFETWHHLLDETYGQIANVIRQTFNEVLARAFTRSLGGPLPPTDGPQFFTHRFEAVPRVTGWEGIKMAFSESRLDSEHSSFDEWAAGVDALLTEVSEEQRQKGNENCS